MESRQSHFYKKIRTQMMDIINQIGFYNEAKVKSNKVQF